MDHTNSIA